MNPTRRSQAQALLIVAVLTAIPGSRAFAGNVFRSMAKDFTSAGVSSKVKRIAVIPFSFKNGAASEEGEYVAEKLSTQLVRLGKVEVVERAMLDKVLDEHRLMLTGAIRRDEAKKVGEILSVDAVVSGSVFEMEEGLGVQARMVDVATGKILFASDAEVERPWVRSAMIPKIEVPVPALEVAAPDLLRDAVADEPAASNCGRAEQSVHKLESAFLDLKARYWAAKLKQPDFSYARLTHNPGSEIADPELRSRFYDLLKAWYGQPEVSSLTPTELAALAHAEDKIQEIQVACGE